MTSKLTLENIQNLVNHGTHIISALRQSLGYSIEDLAVVCGLTSEEIMLIEKCDQVEPTTLARISNAAGFTPETIDQILVKTA
ncbi:hypothetical protein ACLBWZ_14480 [Brucellaceae bacterium C25G]